MVSHFNEFKADRTQYATFILTSVQTTRNLKQVKRVKEYHLKKTPANAFISIIVAKLEPKGQSTKCNYS